MATSDPVVPIRALIFDVDDTLYDKSTGFSYHRNNDGVQEFMVKELNFPDRASAKIVRDEYFQRYHSTAKALLIAEQEGKFPPIIVDDRSNENNFSETVTQQRFDPKMLDNFFATQLNFSLLGGPNHKVVQDLQELSTKFQLVAFSNGPRNYVKRVLLELGLWSDGLFHEHNLFAVNDTLPYCKPDKEAFHYIFRKTGLVPQECVMIEDSMKNIRIAKELGMKTILVTGSGVITDLRLGRVGVNETKHDLPILDDPVVDVVIETIEEIKTGAFLWDPK